jgi:hypothetical protein
MYPTCAKDIADASSHNPTEIACVPNVVDVPPLLVMVEHGEWRPRARLQVAGNIGAAGVPP